ncbi:MAG: M23 family metallopeptidase [Patescibacteria group bacterium]|nr:M23 family metallopeptidase [Patescibacteria group bacterium]MDD5491000.1 M23 family metallopeptidase [Patescibacteria group bacterium]
MIYFGRFFNFLRKNLKPLLAWLAGQTWKFLGRPAIISFYKTYLTIKRFLQKIFVYQQNKFLSVFTNQYAVYVVIIAIVALITFDNLNAQETRREDFGEKSILYSMVKDDLSYNYTIEEGPIVEKESAIPEKEDKLLSYLDSSRGIQSTLRPVPYLIEDVTEEESDLPTAQGDTALVRTNISNTKLGLKTRTETVEYIVEQNDTISSIAEKFSLAVNTMLWANNLSAYSYIRPGDKLKILPADGVEHKVKKGDTVAKIAKQYGSTEEKIIAFNKLTDTSDIATGDILMVPDGKIIPVYSAPARTWSPVDKSAVKPPGSTQIASGKMLWPTSWRVITQYYSWRHSGLDIDGDYRSPLYAAESGTVESAGWLGGYGLQILINHGNGVKTRYGHASKLFVKRGQQVSRGETIAMMGTTGRSTGTHIHFEVIINGRKMNPLLYIK